MGNRAVIALKSMPSIGIYVHWNGGPESVLAFLEATRRRKSRSPASDPSYAFARLVQTTADFFNRGTILPEEIRELLSVGVGPISELDTNNFDNGLYWIGDDWSIVGREFNNGDSTAKPDDLTPDEKVRFETIVATLLRIDEAREKASGE